MRDTQSEFKLIQILYMCHVSNRDIVHIVSVYKNNSRFIHIFFSNLWYRSIPVLYPSHILLTMLITLLLKLNIALVKLTHNIHENKFKFFMDK